MSVSKSATPLPKSPDPAHGLSAEQAAELYARLAAIACVRVNLDRDDWEDLYDWAVAHVRNHPRVGLS